MLNVLQLAENAGTESPRKGVRRVSSRNDSQRSGSGGGGGFIQPGQHAQPRNGQQGGARCKLHKTELGFLCTCPLAESWARNEVCRFFINT